MRTSSSITTAGRLTVALILLTSCMDAPTGSSPLGQTSLDPGDPGGKGFLVQCIQPTDECADPTDTHVIADVAFSNVYVATMNQTFLDPVTGQTTNVLNVTPPNVYVHVEAGYLPNGTPRVTTDYTEGADPSTLLAPQVVHQSMQGDELTDVNVSGQALQFSTPEEMTAEPAMNLVGSVANGDITAGWVVDMADTIVKSEATLYNSGDALRQIVSSRLPAGSAFTRAERGERVSAVVQGVPVTVSRGDDGLIVVEDALDDGAVRSVTGDGGGVSKARHTRRYAKQGKRWLIVEDLTEVEELDSKGKRQYKNLTKFSKMKVFTNAARDSIRRIARPTTDWIARPATAERRSSRGVTDFSSTVGLVAGGGGPNRLVACDDACGGGYSSPPPPAPIGLVPPCTPDVTFTVAEPVDADVNILLQHGIKSDAHTWCQGSEYLRMKVRVGYELRHSLVWRNSYEEQASELGQRFNDDLIGRPGSYVLVGHSNGGRVSRYMAQDRGGASIRGVISVSSPHAGAYLANLDQTVLTAAVAVPIGRALMGCDISNAYICSQGAGVAMAIGAIVGPYMLQGLIPVTKQMGTDAPFIQSINSRGDPFPTAGVRNIIWDRWSMWRLMGENQRCTPLQLVECDAFSRSYVNAVDVTYHRFIKCAIVSGIFGIIWPGARRAAVGCAANAGAMRGMDYAYKRLSVGSAHGDGVVPEHSQIYPGSAVQILVDDSNSHIGETRSRRTANGIVTAMNRAMQVPIFR